MIRTKKHIWHPVTAIKNLFYVSIGSAELFGLLYYIKIVLTNID